MDLPGEESACGEHDRARAEFEPKLSYYAHCRVALEQDVVDRLLEKAEMRLVFKAAADGLAVKRPVGLGARRPHGGTF